MVWRLSISSILVPLASRFSPTPSISHSPLPKLTSSPRLTFTTTSKVGYGPICVVVKLRLSSAGSSLLFARFTSESHRAAPSHLSCFDRDFPMLPEVTTSNYANNFSLLGSDVDPEWSEPRSQTGLQVGVAKTTLHLCAKSSMTFFTTDPHQHHHHPQVKYEGALIPLAKNPKILGVTLDPHFTFSPHAKKVVDKMGSPLKVLKALADRDWGGSPEDMLLTGLFHP